MSPWRSHVERWKDCTRCPLHDGRRNVVLARGSLPCDVLFVGEAPGQSEDVLGEPFVGPAGKLLDTIVEEAWDAVSLPAGEGGKFVATKAFTNVVACFPKDVKETENHAPPKEAIKACRPRLVELVAIAKPKLVVFVGSVADTNAPPALGKAQCLAGGRVMGHVTVKQWASIQHPAAILRAPTAQKSLAVRRAVIILQRALEQM